MDADCFVRAAETQTRGWLTETMFFMISSDSLELL